MWRQCWRVARETARNWFTPNRRKANTCKPKPDARVKIPPQHYPIILDHYEAGATQERIAADYKVEQQHISRNITAGKKQRAAKAERVDTIKKLGSEVVGVHCGGLHEIGHIVEDGSVDLIFTDPVYHTDSAGLYGDLAEFTYRVLRPGASCLAYAGPSFIPEMLNLMRQHLTYAWMFSVQ